MARLLNKKDDSSAVLVKRVWLCHWWPDNNGDEQQAAENENTDKDGASEERLEACIEWSEIISF